MCRTYSIGGLIGFGLTHGLIYYGVWVCNMFGIEYWWYEPVRSERWVSMIPLRPVGLLFYTLFNTTALLGFVSHLRAAFCDPGVISKDLQPPIDLDDPKHCKKCGVWKPERAHHCSECGVCIFKMDHHCPWISSCLGVMNYKYFMLFCLYIFLMSVTGAIALATTFVLVITDE